MRALWLVMPEKFFDLRDTGRREEIRANLNLVLASKRASNNAPPWPFTMASLFLECALPFSGRSNVPIASVCIMCLQGTM